MIFSKSLTKIKLIVIHSIIATFLIRIPISFYLSRLSTITLYEISFAAPLATLISIVMCALYMRSGRWKANKIIGEVNQIVSS